MPSAESGDEVQFGLSLSSPETRTIYGYGEKTETSYPIYWVNGDKVQIYSPQCLSGRNNAEYQVSVDGAKQKYASSLTPTGATGVQWGTEASDFYSVYPSGDYTISDDGKSITDLKINFSDDFEMVDGAVVPKQADCLMFASTKQVAVGSTVNLLYSPIATSVTFTINGPTSGDPVTIQSVKLIAPTGTYIAGNFNVQLCEDESANKGKYIFSDWAKDDNGRTNSSETISAQIYDKSTGAFHEIGVGESLPISFFLVPRTDLAITKDWKIQVVTTNKTFTKSLAFGTEAKTNLAPGMVHELPGLPKLDEGTAEWSVTDWMKNIPRNVYLSEVSIPGSWNSLNKDFQGTNPSISTQYNKGVRAFHLDTRWSTTASQSWLIATNHYDVDDLSADNMYLSVADGATSKKVATGRASGYQGRIMEQNNTAFSEYLGQITSNVKEDEFMVLFCSFAQDSYNDVTKTGVTWMQAISDACDANSAIFDASKLNANTLVGDVLNSVIVIVNCENAVSAETLPKDSKCLFVNIPNKLTSNYFPTTGFKSDALYSSTTTTTALDITMAVSQAQLTSSTGAAIAEGARGYYPSFDQRTNVVNSILDWSMTNYSNKEDYAHNTWIYLGLGGNTAGNQNSTGDDDTAIDVLNVYSPLIYNRIAAMGNNNVPYYPVGIVYLNYTTPNSHTDGDSSETVKSILMLNNKYRLQYDSTKPTDYKPATKSAAASYSSGMNDQGVSAFGWE